MAVNGFTNIVTDGLVLSLDAGNLKSYLTTYLFENLLLFIKKKPWKWMLRSCKFSRNITKSEVLNIFNYEKVNQVNRKYIFLNLNSNFFFTIRKRKKGKFCFDLIK